MTTQHVATKGRWAKVLWYEVLAPAVLIALAVRLEAFIIGPYWAWIELLSVLGEDGDTRRQRRQSIVRRVAIPGIVGFALVTSWSDRFSEWGVALIAAVAVALLLWPAVVHGFAFRLRARDWEIAVLYGAMVGAFAGSGWLGGTVALWIEADYGSVGRFIRQELVSLIVGLVVVAFASGAVEVASTRISRRGGA